MERKQGQKARLALLWSFAPKKHEKEGFPAVGNPSFGPLRAGFRNFLNFFVI